MPSFAHRRPARRGYTLLELLIVAAVMLVVASLTLPALNRPFAKSKLHDAAKQLRVALARARLEAIESGTPQQFRYQPASGLFEISAWSTSEGGGFTPVGAEGVAEDVFAADVVTSPEASESELPKGVRFADPSDPEAPPGEPAPIASEGPESWSAPIIFYPNGRTFNARIRLHGEYDYYVDVTLRGLTGASTVGEVRRFEKPLEQLSGMPPENSR